MGPPSYMRPFVDRNVVYAAHTCVQISGFYNVGLSYDYGVHLLVACLKERRRGNRVCLRVFF